VDSVTINTAPSMFMDENLFDFYIVAYNYILGKVSEAVPTNYILINSYSTTTLTGLSATISNYWTSDGSGSTETLSGNYIPFILRISGNLTTA